MDADLAPAPNSPPLPTDTHVFPAIPHPMGTLSLSTRYLTSPNFQLDELESLLSSRFLSLDGGPEFTPTLAKNQQRDSMSASPGSLPIRTALPRSPPSSIADKFVLPAAHIRTTSLPGSVPSTRSIAPPISRVPSTGPSTSSVASSSRQDSSGAWSKDDGRLVSGIAARIRKESTGAGRGAVSGTISFRFRTFFLILATR
jgi:autophagy-related protein 13